MSEQRRRVLVVEDDAGFTKIMKRKCEAAWGGLVVVCVRTAKAAFAALQAGPAFDLALVDLRIPFDRELPTVETGVALIARIRGPEFGLSKEQLSIVVVTAEDTAKAATKAMLAGANDLVTKDDLPLLVETIRRELGRVAAGGAPRGPSAVDASSVVAAPPPLVPWVPTSLAEVKIVLDGTPGKRTARVVVCGVPSDFQEVPFRVLCRLRLAARKGEALDIEGLASRRSDDSARNYKPISRLRQELRQKGKLPRDLAHAVVCQASEGEYRLAVPVENITVEPTMQAAFRLYLDEADRRDLAARGPTRTSVTDSHGPWETGSGPGQTGRSTRA
jgi:CheY-like chemotaxis protein